MTERTTIVDGNGKTRGGEVIKRELEDIPLLEVFMRAVAGGFTAGIAGGLEQKTTVRDSDGHLWTGTEQ